MAIHKGSELNNVNETWKQNEQGRKAENTGAENTGDATAVNNDLQQTIEEEAAEYDSADKEERLLDGERASVNDKKDTP